MAKLRQKAWQRGEVGRGAGVQGRGGSGEVGGVGGGGSRGMM